MNGRIEKLGEILFGYEGLDSEQIAYYIWAFWYKSVGLKRIQARVIELAKENRALRYAIKQKNILLTYYCENCGDCPVLMLDKKQPKPSLIKRIWDWIKGAKR